MQRSFAPRNLLVGINRPVDPANLSDLEKRHIPVIDAPQAVRQGECFELTVTVGKLLEHPNEHNHFVQYIDLYADETHLARMNLTAVQTCPKVSLRVTLQHPISELRAIARCNLHGVWIGRKPIRVE